MIEGCFAFNLNPEDYQVKAVPSAERTFRKSNVRKVGIRGKGTGYF